MEFEGTWKSQYQMEGNGIGRKREISVVEGWKWKWKERENLNISTDYSNIPGRSKFFHGKISDVLNTKIGITFDRNELFPYFLR